MKLKNLARLRQARGITQAELAELIGVSPSAVYHWEDGTGVTAANLAKLCAAFNVNAEYLLGLQGSTLAKTPHLRRVA